MHFKKFITLFFSELNSLIHSNCFLEKHRFAKNFFTRTRKLSFAEIIRFLLRLPQKTLSHELSNYVSEQLSKKGIQRISKQAFSFARQKIAPSAFAEILDFTYDYLQQLPFSQSNWHGHTVKAIDGTTIRVPNTKQNQEYFQTQENQYGQVALLKASSLYDVSRDLIQKVAFGSCRTSEKTQAMELLTRDTLHDESEAQPIITFDRGYPSGELIEHLLKNDGLFLMRCSCAVFKTVLACPQGDSEATILYKKQKIKLRVIRFFLDSGTEEILITNVWDKNLTIADFKELYFLRWKIELKYRELKQQLKIENFSGITPTAVLQELYATLAFSNIVSVFKVEVDQRMRAETQYSNHKHKYQANRNFLIGELKKNFLLLLNRTWGFSKQLNTLLFLAQKERSPIRPDRKWQRSWHRYGKTTTYCRNQRTAL